MGISISGLSSGIDWQGIIEKLRAVSEKRLQLIKDQQKDLSDRLTAWKDLASKLENLKKAMDNLRDPWDLNLFKASLASSDPSVSPESLLSATVGTNASQGIYNIQVIQRADYQKAFSESFTSTDQDAGKTGFITINGNNISLDGKSLNQIQSDINALNENVLASILKVSDNEYKLVITSKTTGASGFTLDTSNSNMTFTEQAGKNAILSIDGITIERSTNTITDALPGITLEINNASSSTTLTLKVERDYSAIEAKMKDFIDSYNSVLDEIAKHITGKTEANANSGVLNSDFTLQTIKANLQQVYLQAGLYDLGVKINDTNRLEFDSLKFTEAMKSNFDTMAEKINNFASNMYNQLNRLMDPVSGTITLKENSLNDAIKNLEKKINSEQNRIDRQMEALAKQFQTMEQALSEMQSQSQWLSAQLSALMSS